MFDLEYIEFEGKIYPLLTITMFEGEEDEYPETVSNETLSKIIVEAEQAGDYDRVRAVDERVGFFAPDNLFVDKDGNWNPDCEAITKYVEENEF